MMKVIGAGILVVSSSVLGFQIARWYRDRPRQLRILMQALRVLKTEIEYHSTPLQQALEEVSARVERPVSRLFQSAAQALAEPGRSPEEALARGIAQTSAESALRQEDVLVLRDFGRTLGTSDSEHQALHLNGALMQLEVLEREARQSQQQHERLWQYIGVLTGLLIAVLLL